MVPLRLPVAIFAQVAACLHSLQMSSSARPMAGVPAWQWKPTDGGLYIQDADGVWHCGDCAGFKVADWSHCNARGHLDWLEERRQRGLLLALPACVVPAMPTPLAVPLHDRHYPPPPPPPLTPGDNHDGPPPPPLTTPTTPTVIRVTTITNSRSCQNTSFPPTTSGLESSTGLVRSCFWLLVSC